MVKDIRPADERDRVRLRKAVIGRAWAMTAFYERKNKQIQDRPSGHEQLTNDEVSNDD